MTRIINDPAAFAEDMLVGFLDAKVDPVQAQGRRRRGHCPEVAGGVPSYSPIALTFAADADSGSNS